MKRVVSTSDASAAGFRVKEAETTPIRTHARFGAFEVNLRSGELRKHGIKIKLQEKPFQILALLVEQPGEVVTREELQRRLWPADTFVDFDRNLNTATNRLRQALGDSAENPRFIETIPRRGYRFIFPVNSATTGAYPYAPTDGERPEGAGEASASAPSEPVPRGTRRTVLMTALAVLMGVAGVYGVWATLEPASRSFGMRAEKTMLVVLPFENLSGDPQQDYISDGLTDEMIAQIGRLNPEHIGVIARTSSMHYKGARKSVAEIGKELGVDFLLEGTVRRSSGPSASGLVINRVRITAQLVAVREQTPLWSQTYERDASDLLSIQQDVAAHIASALALKLTAEGPSAYGLRVNSERSKAGLTSRTPNADVYEAYLLGRYYWNKRTAEGLYKGLEHFQRAIDRDPNFAPAHAGIADSYLVLAGLYLLPPQQAYPKAKAAAERALQLDPTLAEANASLAGVTFQYDWDWPRAEQQFLRAIELNPAYPTAHQWYAAYLSAMGRHDEALREIQTARRLDPLSLITITTDGILRYQARRYDEALATCQHALELDPGFFMARVCVATVYVKKRMYKEGVEQRYKAMLAEGIAKEDQEKFWRAYATDGIRGAQRWLIQYRAQRLSKNPGKEYIPGYYLAVLHGALGERDRAFEWLDRSFQQRDSFLTRLKVDPNLDDLRDDPRFRTFLDRLKLN
jgi:TolB-like protein/DNA-binding winged helix-turn-helix (wHTH) protein/Tfp pilus assembly protein PilF